MRPIYLVEDNKADRELVQILIGQSGLENPLRIFNSPEEAKEEIERLTQLESHDSLPHFILLDMVFPGGMDGLEFLLLLRQNEFTAYVPVLIMTSSSQDESIKVAYALGANDYLIKPVTADKLLLALQTLGLKWRIIQ